MSLPHYYYCRLQALYMQASVGLCAPGVSLGDSGISVGRVGGGKSRLEVRGWGFPEKIRELLGTQLRSLSLWPITFLGTNYIYPLNQQYFLLRSREKRRTGKGKGKEML